MKSGNIKIIASASIMLLLSACTAEQEGRSVTGSKVGTVTVSWTPPVARSNGDPLTPSEISGYRVYYGTQSGSYPNQIAINDGSAQQATVSGERGFYYIVITTVDTAGRESAFSEEFMTNI